MVRERVTTDSRFWYAVTKPKWPASDPPSPWVSSTLNDVSTPPSREVSRERTVQCTLAGGAPNSSRFVAAA